jgi:hypothetical protein
MQPTVVLDLDAACTSLPLAWATVRECPPSVWSLPAAAQPSGQGVAMALRTGPLVRADGFDRQEPHGSEPQVFDRGYRCYVAVGGPNQVVSASGSPDRVMSPTQPT